LPNMNGGSNTGLEVNERRTSRGGNVMEVLLRIRRKKGDDVTGKKVKE